MNGRQRRDAIAATALLAAAALLILASCELAGVW